MHGPGRYADIDAFDTEFSCRQRSDSRAAGHIASHYEFLFFHSNFATEQSENGSTFRVGTVALGTVQLDHRTFVKNDRVVRVTFIGKVRVTGMGIVQG